MLQESHSYPVVLLSDLGAETRPGPDTLDIMVVPVTSVFCLHS